MFSSNADDNRPDQVDMTDIEDAETPEEVCELLNDIPEKYSKWIGGLQEIGRDIEHGSKFEDAAKYNQERCMEGA